MSDTAAPLTTTETAAPVSSADIAADVIQSAERGDPGVTGEPASYDLPDTSTETRATETQKIEPTKAEISKARQFLQKLGHLETNKRGGNTYLPYNTVEKMLDKYAEEHGTTWQTERTTLEQRAKDLETHIAQLRDGIMGEDTDALIRELAEANPKFARYLQAQTAAREVPTSPNDPMPQPDFDLGNGAKTYSVEGLQKLREWDRREATREVLANVEERLKPLTAREEAAKAAEVRDRAITTAREAVNGQLSEAQTWWLFGKLADDGSLTEFQQAVLDEMKADSEKAKAENRRPKLTLEGAYIRIASKRMSEDDTTKRERLLKEINGAAKSTSTGRPSAEATATPAGKRTTADIVRETIARAETGA